MTDQASQFQEAKAVIEIEGDHWFHPSLRAAAVYSACVCPVPRHHEVVQTCGKSGCVKPQHHLIKLSLGTNEKISSQFEE